MHDDPKRAPSRPQQAASKTSKKRKLVYALGGCGCLSVGLAFLAIVGLVALGALAGDSADDKKESGTNNRGTLVSKPTEKRARQARKQAEAYLDHLSNGREAAAWKMTSEPLRGIVTREAFSQFAGEVHDLTSTKDLHLVDTGTTVSRDNSGQTHFVQEFSFEYRNGKERRIYQCKLHVHDSTLDQKGNASADHDLEILGSQCKRAYIHYRKGWGGEIPEKFAEHADTIKNLVGDGWPDYPLPEHDAKAATSVADRFRGHLVRRRYKKAIKMLSPDEAKRAKPSDLKELIDILKKAGLASAQLEFKEWKTSSTNQTWIDDGVATETYSIEITLKGRGNSEPAFLVDVGRRFDHNKPKGRRAGSFYVDTLSIRK